MRKRLLTFLLAVTMLAALPALGEDGRQRADHVGQPAGLDEGYALGGGKQNFHNEGLLKV